VSSTTRDVLKKNLDLWIPNSKLVTSKLIARSALEADSQHRITVFEGVFKEILTMLYQNLWTKFQVAEAQALALEDEDTVHGSSFPFRGSFVNSAKSANLEGKSPHGPSSKISALSSSSSSKIQHHPVVNPIPDIKEIVKTLEG
jgi:hypothetical protein